MRKESDSRAILARVREVLRPRARIEMRLRGDGEVRGRLDGLTPRLLLELVGAIRKDARVAVRDATYLYEIEIRDGAPRKATRTASDGGYPSGERALASLLGVGAGPLRRVARAPSRSAASSRARCSSSSRARSRPRAARSTATTGARTMNVERIAPRRGRRSRSTCARRPTRRARSSGASRRARRRGRCSWPARWRRPARGRARRSRRRAARSAASRPRTAPTCSRRRVEAALSVLRGARAPPRSIPPNARPSAVPAPVSVRPRALSRRVAPPPAAPPSPPAPAYESLARASRRPRRPRPVDRRCRAVVARGRGDARDQRPLAPPAGRRACPTSEPSAHHRAERAAPALVEPARPDEARDSVDERRSCPRSRPTRSCPRPRRHEELRPGPAGRARAAVGAPASLRRPSSPSRRTTPSSRRRTRRRSRWRLAPLAGDPHAAAPARGRPPRPRSSRTLPLAPVAPPVVEPQPEAPAPKRSAWPIARRVRGAGGWPSRRWCSCAARRRRRPRRRGPATTATTPPRPPVSRGAERRRPRRPRPPSRADELPPGAEVPAGLGLVEVTRRPGPRVRIDGAIGGRGPQSSLVAAPGYHEVRIEQDGPRLEARHRGAPPARRRASSPRRRREARCALSPRCRRLAPACACSGSHARARARRRRRRRRRRPRPTRGRPARAARGARRRARPRHVRARPPGRAARLRRSRRCARRCTPARSPAASDEIVEHEGATWLRVRARAVTASFYWPAGRRRRARRRAPTSRLRAARRHGARGRRLDRRQGPWARDARQGRGARARHGARVGAARRSPRAATSSRCTSSGGPRSGDEPLAEIDWVSRGHRRPGRALRRADARRRAHRRHRRRPLAARAVAARAGLRALLGVDPGGRDARGVARHRGRRRRRRRGAPAARPAAAGRARHGARRGRRRAWAPWTVPVTGLEGDGRARVARARGQARDQGHARAPRRAAGVVVAGRRAAPPRPRRAAWCSWCSGARRRKALAPWGGPHAGARARRASRRRGRRSPRTAPRARSRAPASRRCSRVCRRASHGLDDPDARLPARADDDRGGVPAGRRPTAMFTANPTTGAAFGFDRGWDTFVAHDPLERRRRPPRSSTTPRRGSTRTRPARFLVVVHARGGHPPWDATPEELKTMPPEGYLGMLEPRRAAEALAKAHKHTGRFKEDDRTRAWALYDHAVDAHDAALGRLLAALRAAGRDDDTAVIVTGDVAPTEAPAGALRRRRTRSTSRCSRRRSWSAGRRGGALARQARGRAEQPGRPRAHDARRAGPAPPPEAFQGEDLAPSRAAPSSPRCGRWPPRAAPLRRALGPVRPARARATARPACATCRSTPPASPTSAPRARLALEPIHRWALDALAPATPPPLPARAGARSTQRHRGPRPLGPPVGRKGATGGTVTFRAPSLDNTAYSRQVARRRDDRVAEGA